jgi:hypothetical protein
MTPTASRTADLIREQLALYGRTFEASAEVVEGGSTVLTGHVAEVPVRITVRSSTADGPAYRYSISVVFQATGLQVGVGNPDRTVEAAIRFFHWQDVALATGSAADAK